MLQEINKDPIKKFKISFSKYQKIFKRIRKEYIKKIK